MTWFPTNENIIKEVENYKRSSFIKKSKNLLVCFIFFVVFLTIIFQDGLNLDNIPLIIAVSYNLVLACFIYLNHRWAMIIFCSLYIIDKILYILLGQSIIPNLLFGIIAVTLTISSFKVASKIKKINKTITK